MPRLASCRLIVFAVVILVLGFPTFARAQKDAGSIVGTVQDSTGALVRNAKVTVTDVERGTNFSATTNDAGEYVAGPLHVGRYTVTVEPSGFEKAVVKNFPISERTKLEFRAEFFNLFNHPNLQFAKSGPQIRSTPPPSAPQNLDS